MSARRAVALTLLVVAVLAGVAIGGYVGITGYRDAGERADRAEARADAAESRFRGQRVPRDQLRAEYDRGFEAGKAAGANDVIGFLESPGFYVVEVTEDENYPLSIKEATKMVDCRQYHVDRAGTVAYPEEQVC